MRRRSWPLRLCSRPGPSGSCWPTGRPALPCWRAALWSRRCSLASSSAASRRWPEVTGSSPGPSSSSTCWHAWPSRRPPRRVDRVRQRLRVRTPRAAARRPLVAAPHARSGAPPVVAAPPGLAPLSATPEVPKVARVGSGLSGSQGVPARCHPGARNRTCRTARARRMCAASSEISMRHHTRSSPGRFACQALDLAPPW